MSSSLTLHCTVKLHNVNIMKSQYPPKSTPLKKSVHCAENIKSPRPKKILEKLVQIYQILQDVFLKVGGLLTTGTIAKKVNETR